MFRDAIEFLQIQSPFGCLRKFSISMFFWLMVIYTMLAQMVPGGEMREGDYALYLLVLVVWSAVSYKFIEKGE